MIAAVTALVLYLVPYYLNGLADYWEIIALFVGVLLIMAEVFGRLRATGTSCFADYLVALEKNGGDEGERFVNSLSTNLASFFREPHHFPIFAEHLHKLGTRRPIRVWCSAASSGEEPYSIAITVAETFGSNTSHVSIMASDLDTNVLATAQKGVYPIERVEKLSPERLRKFFLRGTGAQEGYVSVRPELKNMIQFQRLNLLDQSYAVKGPLDVIFCRNVSARTILASPLMAAVAAINGEIVDIRNYLN